jgi:hypothetical protein
VINLLPSIIKIMDFDFVRDGMQGNFVCGKWIVTTDVMKSLVELVERTKPANVESLCNNIMQSSIPPFVITDRICLCMLFRKELEAK